MHEKLNRRIAELDLEPIMVKVLDPEDPMRRARAERAAVVKLHQDA